MFSIKKIALAAAVLAACAVPGYAAEMPACAPRTSEQQLADAETMALLWMRTAAEYRALCYQGYNAAMAEICDETVVDNTPALGGAAAAGNGRYTSPWWNEWVAQGNSAAMPGAADFLNEVHKSPQKGSGHFLCDEPPRIDRL